MPKYYKHNTPITLESGDVLPEVTIAYDTFGKLNSDKSNVIWVCHALTANSDVADWWPHTVEKGKFLDPEKYFIVCANTLGSCYGTTGPTSINPETGEPYYGDFPLFTIRDIVKLHQLLAEHLQINSLYALIGSSLGGFQALEWLLADPEITNRAILIATGTYCRPWEAAFNASMYMAFDADPTYGERRDDAGQAALACARSIAMLSYRGHYAYDLTQKDTEHRPSPFYRRVHSYQQHQGEKLCDRFNAYSYVRLCQSADSHDIGRDRGSVAEALASIKAHCLVCAISSDLLFPLADHSDMVDNIRDCEFHVIESEFAHDGFLIEHVKLNELILNFFKKTTI
jgi:homoserine O-acetyltransferase